jgi:Fic family protein
LEEARDSSEIENIFTTRDKMYKAMALSATKIDPATKEVLRYRESLWWGYHEVTRHRMLTTDLIIKMQKSLIEKNTGIRKRPGTYIGNRATGEVTYTPPDGERRIRDLLKNLEVYLGAADSIDPLIKLGVIHYQFEAIHPFYDGNGRTGRIVNVLYLIHQGLLELPILYMSSYIIKNKSRYYTLLRKVTAEQAWEEWILFMLDAIEQTSNETIEKVNKIKILLDKTINKVRKEAPKIYSKELVELLFHQPYTRIGYLVEAGLAARKAAALYLRELEEIKVLKSLKVGKEVIFINVPLFNIFSQNAKFVEK